jgi:hypothetical protein
MNNEICILSAQHISAQMPLCEDWIERPVLYSEEYVRAVEPNYREYFSVLEARRYGRLLKRALLVSRKAMEQSGVNSPDAIITGTGLGCIENTELFLKELIFSEELLKPTHFILSTHNTISSIIAIVGKCNSYNSTYAHKGISFECALQDAFMQLHSRKIRTALVGGHDEMTPDYFAMLKKTGYLNFPEQGFAGETAVAMVLGTEKTDGLPLCKIDKVEILYSTDIEAIADVAGRFVKPDYILTGINGQRQNDRRYFDVCKKIFPGIPLLQYKNIFGESYTASSLGVYVAANCLQKENIPVHLLVERKNAECKSAPSKILFYNNFEGKNHSLILLSRCLK